MDQQEWNSYVHTLATCPYPIPPYLVANQEDWKCRSIVGRMLYILKDIEGAMAVLSTVKDIQPDMEDAPETGLSECEHKVLCLRDIAEIVWQLTGMAQAPLVYLKDAEHLCRVYKHPFKTCDRGFIWVRQLELMRECGRGKEASQLAAAMLQEAKPDKRGVSPYLYHALKFMAEDMATLGKLQEAVSLYLQAYKYYPQSQAGDKALAAAQALPTPQEQYQELCHCSTITYARWEETKVPTIEEVRELQMKNFLRRQAKGESGDRKELWEQANE